MEFRRLKRPGIRIADRIAAYFPGDRIGAYFPGDRIAAYFHNAEYCAMGLWGWRSEF